jgi:hypothetical protein
VIIGGWDDDVEENDGVRGEERMWERGMEKSKAGWDDGGTSFRMSKEQGVIRRMTGVREEWMVQRSDRGSSFGWRQVEARERGGKRDGRAGSIEILGEDGAEGESVEWLRWCLIDDIKFYGYVQARRGRGVVVEASRLGAQPFRLAFDGASVKRSRVFSLWFYGYDALMMNAYLS